MVETGVLETDVLVVGSEGAGSRAAIAASDEGATVLMVSKGRFGKSGATITGVGGMAIDSRSVKEILRLPGDEADSKEAFFEDIVRSGKFINNQKLAKIVVNEGPARVQQLAEWGMKITTVMRTPGHRFPRSVLTSGHEIMRVLKKEVKKRKVRVIEDLMVTDLLTDQERVIGATALDLRTGNFICIKAKAVVMATGGGMMVFAVQTAPLDLTGDGQAIAYRAGAQLIDMEMTQFHPCNFLAPPMWSGIGFPFTIGPGGGLEIWLLNKWGERFMRKWDADRLERTTRDVLSLAIMTEVQEGRGSPAGGVYMSLAHLPYNMIEDFGKWYFKDFMKEEWVYGKFNFRNLAEDLKKGYGMEVGPASHFFMGGIRIDENCATNLPGLYAAGEVAGGLNGANRLSDVAYTQILVQGARAGQVAGQFAKGANHGEVSAEELAKNKDRIMALFERRLGDSPFELKKQIQKLAWEKVGVIRSGPLLAEALITIKDMTETILPRISCKAHEKEYNREWIEAIQVANLLTTLEAIANSANTRMESRGAHYRKDKPTMDNRNWLKNIVIKKEKGLMNLESIPVQMTYFSLPKELAQ